MLAGAADPLLRQANSACSCDVTQKTDATTFVLKRSRLVPMHLYIAKPFAPLASAVQLAPGAPVCCMTMLRLMERAWN